MAEKAGGTGTTELITWASTNNVENIKIDYSTNNGSTWINVVTSTPSAPGSYPWTIPNTPASESLVKITDVSNSELYDISQSTFIIIQDVTGVLESKDIPISYSLYQNFPNPYNPSATIKYQIPNAGFVVLKVYDVLGNVVATLVNEQNEAGSYQVLFDASALSSGVYIYQISVNDFVDTKKMILMK